MNNDLKNILSNLNKDIEQEKLLQYLSRGMNDEEQNEFERNTADDDFTNDALEGLEQVKNKKDLGLLAEQMNAGLRNEIKKKTLRKKRRNNHQQPFSLYAVILILILAIVAYIIIKRLQ